ncbi:hypothetical protein LguiA_023397 [Lonicera macranthoides]
MSYPAPKHSIYSALKNRVTNTLIGYEGMNESGSVLWEVPPSFCLVPLSLSDFRSRGQNILRCSRAVLGHAPRLSGI